MEQPRTFMERLSKSSIAPLKVDIQFTYIGVRGLTGCYYPVRKLLITNDKLGRPVALKYKYDITRKIVDWFVQWLIRLDRAPQHYYLLTVPGRNTGLPHSKPVALVEKDGQKWLVAPYGEVNWVLNARVAGKVIIARGGHAEEFSIKELQVEERASVLKQYITLFPITRPYFDAQPSDSVEKFIPEAKWRPVFQLKN